MHNPNKDVRARPVDALFGESTRSPVPAYTVEPAQPATTVSPPAPGSTPEPTPLLPKPPAGDTGVTPPPPTSAAPGAEAPSPPLQDDTRFAGLSFQIERLYDEVKIELLESQAATDFCLGLLLQARQAYERRDYPATEFYLQTVDAKLKRSAKSMRAARSLTVWLLWLWELFALGVGGLLLALTYVVNLTLFGLPVAAELLVLARAAGWGMIGGVLGAIYNLPWFVQFREYDPAYNMNYFMRPLQGLLIGAVLFLLSQAGILASGGIIPVELGQVPTGPLVLYIFAVLAGFKQEYVTEFLDGLLKAMFRVPQVPKALQAPTAKK